MRKYKNFIWKVLKIILGRRKYEIVRGMYNLGYIPNIKNPSTFNEKLMHQKIYQNMDFAIDLADKYAVRDYVEQKIGGEFLNKILYVGEDLSAVDWSTLPNQFAIKTTHGGGDEGNLLVFNKDDISVEDAIERTNKNLRKKFGYWTNEDWYSKIPPRLIIEELMIAEDGNVPTDYKFFCFHGKCHYIQINIDRYEGYKIGFYDPDWVLQDFTLGKYPPGQAKKPEKLSEMLCLAEKLSKDFEFVRVDLYSLPQGLRFGELTFSPNSGFECFNPREIDHKLGNLI